MIEITQYKRNEKKEIEGSISNKLNDE